jgi:hypothetical protein
VKTEGRKWAGLAVAVIIVIFPEGYRSNESSWSDSQPEEGSPPTFRERHEARHKSERHMHGKAEVVWGGNEAKARSSKSEV